MLEEEERAQEQRLIAAMASGDSRAIAALYDAFSGLLFGIARSMLGDQSEAEDLVHDVFVESWEKASSFDPKRGSLRTWLCLRLRSRALDRIKRRRSQQAGLQEVMHNTNKAHVEMKSVDPLGKKHLPHALSQLSQEQQNVVALAYFEGLSCSEIAGKLKVPIGTVKSRLAGAKRSLKRDMSGVQT